MLSDVIYSLILDLCLGVVVLHVLQDFWSFYPAFALQLLYFDLPHGHPCYAPTVEQRKSKNSNPA